MAALKIVLLFEFPSLNGGEHSMLSCIKRLQQTDLDRPHLKFFAAGPEHGPLAEQLLKLGVPLTKFDTHDASGIKYSPAQLEDQMRSVLAHLQPDIIHSNSLSMSRNVGRMPDALFPMTLRSGHLRDIMKLNRAAIRDLNRNDALVAVSNATRDFHVSRGLHSEKCQTIYNGVDTQIFAPTGQQNRRSKCLAALPNGAICVLNVGQICLRKGQHDLALAIVNLLPNHPQLHLVLAGNRHSQKAESIQYETAIHKAFADQGLSKHLHCIGYQHDVHQLMNEADVLVHAAKQEPLGRVLLEAAACELPIIATDVGGTSEILGHSEQAILVSPDVMSLQDAITGFLHHRDVAATRARSARNCIQTRFSIKTASIQLSEFWRSLKARSRPN